MRLPCASNAALSVYPIGARRNRTGRPAARQTRPRRHPPRTAFHRGNRSGSGAPCFAPMSAIRSGATASWQTSTASVTARRASRSDAHGCVSCAKNRRMKRCTGDANGNIGCPRRSITATLGDSTPATSATVKDCRTSCSASSITARGSRLAARGSRLNIALRRVRRFNI